MAAVVDVTGSKLIGGSSVSSINYSGITVGSGSNRALVVTLALGSTGVTSGWAATWDNGGTNQAMTVVASKVTGTSAASSVIFGLRNPTSGNKTLNITWTGAQFPSVCAISFTGVEQSSDANAFKNSITGSTSSLTVTSATGNIPVALIATSANLTSLNQTSIYLDITSSGADSASSRAAGAATVTFTASGATGSIAMAGIDVAASTGGSSTLTAVQGSYTLTGEIQTLDVGLPVTQGSYTLVGETQTLAVGLPTQQGNYTLNGQPQTLNSFRSITATEGSYTVVGESIIPAIGLPASQGSYSVTGEAQTLGIGLPATQGNYALTGEAQSLTFVPFGNVITASQGSYAVTGETQVLSAGISANHGNYNLTGQSQVLAAGVGITQGNYSVSGENVTLTKTGVNVYTISVTEGVYTLTGKSIQLDYSSGIVVGGKSRWKDDYEKLSKDRHQHSEDIKKAASILSKLGGYARAKSLSAIQRSNIASTAAKIRWK